jgi:chromosomal replication initiation ATPase DnaA
MKQDIFEEYVDKVTNRFGISREQFFTKDKTRDIVDARQMLYYLCRQRPMTAQYIKLYMGTNGYDVAVTTVTHGIKRVEKEMVQDPDYITIINKLK